MVNDRIVSILGKKWDTEEDCIFLKSPKPTNKEINTKRTILRYVSQIFDPLGLLSPSLLLGKLFVQKLWKMELGWDDQLPSDLNLE